MRKLMKKGIAAILLVVTMLGLTACGGSEVTASKLSESELATIYQEFGIQSIDEVLEGVMFAEPAFKNQIGTEGSYKEFYEELGERKAKASDPLYTALYGLGTDAAEATAKVEAYREYILSQGYVEDIPGEDEFRLWDGVFVKENVGIVMWYSGGAILSDEGEKSAAEGQEAFCMELIPFK